jgi:arylsulfatase A-like enzyme
MTARTSDALRELVDARSRGGTHEGIAERAQLSAAVRIERMQTFAGSKPHAFAVVGHGLRAWPQCGKNGDCTRDGENSYPLWGQVLGDAGYRTYAVGKWHNGQQTLEAAFQTTRPVILGGMLESTKVDGPAPGNVDA